MQKTISAIQARQNLGNIMNEVALRGDEYIIERSGKPMVAIVPLNKYEILKRGREDLKNFVEELRGEFSDDNPEEIEAMINEAVKEVRKQNYEV